MYIDTIRAILNHIYSKKYLTVTIYYICLIIFPGNNKNYTREQLNVR